MAFWRNVISVLSLVIAVVAACFAGAAAYFAGMQWQVAESQWHDNHTQFLLSIKPHITFDTEDDTDLPLVGIAITNAGPGPAIIKSLTYYVDRKRMNNYSDAIDAGKVNADIVDYFQLEPDDALAVGERNWLLKYVRRRGAKVNEKQVDDFLDFIDRRVAVEVSFCSALGECWTKCSTTDWCR